MARLRIYVDKKILESNEKLFVREIVLKNRKGIEIQKARFALTSKGKSLVRDVLSCISDSAERDSD